MEKPIVLIREEFIDKLKDLVNGSGLPPFMLHPILQDFLNQIIRLENEQYTEAKKEYENWEKTQTATPYGEE